jgi:hypothetical protein
MNMATKLPVTQLCYGEGIEFKSYICNKKSNILVFNYNIHYHIMNSVSVYSILSTNKLIKPPLCFLLPRIFTVWCPLSRNLQ